MKTHTNTPDPLLISINETTWEQLARDVGEECMPLIINQFLEELSERPNSLNQALVAKDLQNIAEQAHVIKSTARTVGLDAIADLANETESAAKVGNVGSALDCAKLLSQYCVAGCSLLEAKLKIVD